MFSPWVRKILWRRAWQPTPVFLPGESPWTEEPGGLQSMGLQRVEHNCSNLAHTHAKHGCVYSYLFFDKFIYGSAGSLLLQELSLIVASRGSSSLPCAGSSLWWLLLLQRTGSRARRLQLSWHVGSVATTPQL